MKIYLAIDMILKSWWCYRQCYGGQAGLIAGKSQKDQSYKKKFRNDYLILLVFW